MSMYQDDPGLVYIRHYYDKPAYLGVHVRLRSGQLGTIVGSSGPHLMVRLATPWHPTDLEYLVAGTKAPLGEGE